MTLVFSHTKWMILELLRSPAYVVSTIAFPALFYSIFAIPESNDKASSNMLLASFSAFAVFGVIFLQFGVGIAQERTRSWYFYLKTLPVQPLQIMAARFLSALFFSLLASLGIILLAVLFTEAELTLWEWAKFILVLQWAGIVFCFMGLSLGYWSSEKSSLPIGNLIYLPLSFAGGLWKPPNILPSALQDISEYLPTRYYGEVLWAVVKSESIRANDVLFLGFYAVVFAAIAYLGYRKDQGTARS
jgi:ABC-2 type transport system permease protein